MNRNIAAFAVGAALALSISSAKAESWFHFEAGIGAAHISDMGDGVWVQQGAPGNHEKKTSLALMAGVTGQIYAHGNWDLRYHADYVYLGEYSASVLGVPDDQYDPRAHQIVHFAGERYSPFNGHGHAQGVPLTLDVGYTTHGWRFGAEAGPWVYWQTWHESLYDLADQWDNLSHRSVAQVGFVAGASVERGPLSLSYRYYQISQRWDPYPGLATGAHVLALRYRI